MLFKNKRKIFWHQAWENSSNKKWAWIELADLSIYNFWDDAKYIDWLASARSGHIYTKNFVEDKSVDILLLVDRGQSMKPKQNIQTKIIKLIVSEAKKSWDNLKIFSYENHLKSWIIDFWKDYFSNLNNALENFLAKKIKRHIIVILSDDFCNIDILKKLNSQNQIFFVNLFSKNDIKPEKVFGNFGGFRMLFFWQRKDFEKKIQHKITTFWQECKNNKIIYSYFVENNYTLKQIINFFSS